LPLPASALMTLKATASDDTSEPPTSCLCNECGEIFTSLQKLSSHMRKHRTKLDNNGYLTDDGIEAGRVYQCNECQTSFSSPKALLRHMQKHEKQHFICEQCGHESKSKSGFNNHKRHIHPPPGSSPPRFACDVCGRRCWSARALRLHQVAHADAGLAKRKSMCSICGMRFRHVYNLGFHISSIHPNEHPLPFSCATCSEQFDSGDSFKTHYRSKHRNR
jgi:uncharacterized Zn-finger protein